MSPLKSPGQRVGQLLDPSGRELLGRDLDIGWSIIRPHLVGYQDVPTAIIEQAASEADKGPINEQWIWWRPCFDDLCECNDPPNMEGVLDAFLALEEGTAADVEAFVFRYGNLTGCIHLRAHLWTGCREPLTQESSEAFSVVYWEAPAAYRGYARLFRNLLAASAEIQSEVESDLNLWTAIVMAIPGDERVSTLDRVWRMAVRDLRAEEIIAVPRDQFGLPIDPRVIAEAIVDDGIERHLLAQVMSYLMGEDTIGLLMQWPVIDGEFAEKPQAGLVTSTFGILSYQLAVAIQDGAFAVCSNCHKTYAPSRKPQTGRANYCPACRDARKGAYKRRRREKE